MPALSRERRRRPMQRKTTNILTYMGFTKQNQFSPDIKERPPDGANRLTEERRGKWRKAIHRRVCAAVDRDRLFQAYSKAHPRA